MAYPDKINALVDVSADETLAAGGHAARHNDVNDALDELEAVFTAPATNELALRPDGSTERVRLTSGGSVLIGTTTPGSAGAGDLVINGGVFLGGSAAANELDDYEEGTWTPEYVATGGGSATDVTAAGLYRKIGSVVHCIGLIRGKVGTLSGDISIDGLPFTPVGRNGGAAIGFARFFATDMPNLRLRYLTTSTVIRLDKHATNAGGTQVTNSDMSSAFSSSNYLEFTLTYFV